MKKLNFKSLLAVLLAVMMVLSLAACGGKVDETEPDETIVIPADTDPIETEAPVDTDPSEIDPADPSETDPKYDPIETEPKYDPIETDPVETAPAETEPVDPATCEHNYMIKEITPSTDDEPGVTAEVCSKCGHVRNESDSAPEEHIHDDYTGTPDIMDWRAEFDATTANLRYLCYSCGSYAYFGGIKEVINDGLEEVYSACDATVITPNADTYWLFTEVIGVEGGLKAGKYLTIGDTELFALDSANGEVASVEFAIFVENNTKYTMFVDGYPMVWDGELTGGDIVLGDADLFNMSFINTKIVVIGECDEAIVPNAVPHVHSEKNAIVSMIQGETAFEFGYLCACGADLRGNKINELIVDDLYDVYGGKTTLEYNTDASVYWIVADVNVRSVDNLGEMVRLGDQVLLTADDFVLDYAVTVKVAIRVDLDNSVATIYINEVLYDTIALTAKAYDSVTFGYADKAGEAAVESDFRVKYAKIVVLGTDEAVAPNYIANTSLPACNNVEIAYQATLSYGESKIKMICKNCGDYVDVTSDVAHEKQNIDNGDGFTGERNIPTSLDVVGASNEDGYAIAFNYKLDNLLTTQEVSVLSVTASYGTGWRIPIFLRQYPTASGLMMRIAKNENAPGFYLEAGVDYEFVIFVNPKNDNGRPEHYVFVNGEFLGTFEQTGDEVIPDGATNANFRINDQWKNGSKTHITNFEVLLLNENFVMGDDVVNPEPPETEAPETEAPAPDEPLPEKENELIAIDGAFVRGGDYRTKVMSNPSQTNANIDYLEVRDDNDTDATTLNGDQKSYGRMAFIKFDLTKLNGQKLESAVLSVSFKEGYTNRAYNFYIAENNWTRSTITADTAPAVVGGVSLVNAMGAGATSVDIADLINAALKAGEDEITIMISADKTYFSNAGGQSQIAYNATAKPIVEFKIAADQDWSDVPDISVGNEPETEPVETEAPETEAPETEAPVDCDNHTVGLVEYGGSVVKYVCDNCGAPIWKSTGVILNKWTDDNDGNGFSGERTVAISESGVKADVDGGYVIALTYKLGSITNPNGEVSILSLVGKRDSDYYIPVFLRQAVVDGELVMKISKAADAPYFKLEAGVAYNILILVDPANAEGKTEHVVYVNGKKIGQITQDVKIPSTVDAGSVYIRINDGWNNKSNTRIYDLEVLSIGDNFAFPEEPVVVECDNHTAGTLSYDNSVVKYICDNCGTPIWKSKGVEISKWDDTNNGNGFSGERTINVDKDVVSTANGGGYAIYLKYELGAIANPDGEVSVLSIVSTKNGSYYIPAFLRQAVVDGELVMKIANASGDVPYFKLTADTEYEIFIIVNPNGKHAVYVDGELVGTYNNSVKIPSDVDDSVYFRINDQYKNKCKTFINHFEVFKLGSDAFN